MLVKNQARKETGIYGDVKGSLRDSNASFDDQRTNHVASFSAALGLFEYRLKKHIIKQESSGLSYLR